MRHPVLAAMLLLPLAGCGNLERLSRVGDPPALAPITDPTADRRWRPISMPMPNAQMPPPLDNSLWRPGSRTFLRDQRAAQVGDLVTILVAVADEAQLRNQTARGRTNAQNMGMPAMLGLEASVPTVFPSTLSPSNMVDTNSSLNNTGTGEMRRQETITLRIATTVLQVLPNGNLVVQGRQQMRVNSELRDLTLAGIIRPQDIASDNTVRHDRLAEARISYGGRGTVSDVQAPRFGQEILDIILPF
jgi:flagellar L-ring protein precursor FlgH